MDIKKLMIRRNQLAAVGEFAFPWLVSLAEVYKSCGVYPLSLCDYYNSCGDVEIAGLVDVLIPDGSSHDLAFMEVRGMLGDNPSDMVSKRLFITLSPPDDEESWIVLPFLRKTDVVALLDWYYQIKYRMGESLSFVIERVLDGDPFYAFPNIFDVIGNSFPTRQRLRLYQARMSLPDGFGKGLWTDFPADLTCPLTEDVKWTLGHFYRLEKVTEDNVNEILEYIGFERPVDFLYAAWGLRDLMCKRKDETTAFLKSFREHLELKNMLRWCSGIPYYEKRLKAEIPNI